MEYIVSSNFIQLQPQEISEINGGADWGSIGSGVQILGVTALAGARIIPHPIAKTTAAVVGFTALAIGTAITAFN